MRRRRKPLEVSTFPFLAVLLCTMGSLILVLLVMDRKAKEGARTKALAALSHAADAAEQMAAARRAELESHLQEQRAERQAEWAKKRAALHTKLLTEQQALQLQMQQLRGKMTLAAARLRLEQEQSGEVKKKVETGRGQVQGEAQALAAAQQRLGESDKRTAQEKAALARMTNDLVVLERALQDLKETRERERQTYSVVPYNGKRGESQRPLYVECAKASAIFHPDKKAVNVLEHPEQIRAEVARRVARQREQLAAAKLPFTRTPYLMLLVRPDGIYSYYAFEAALAGLDVQFGYELIDADWLLDFPQDDQPGRQTWQALAKQPQLPPLDPPPPSDTQVRGVRFQKSSALQPLFSGSGAGAGALSGTQTPGGPGGRGGESVVPGDNPLSPGGLGRPVAVGDRPGSAGGVAGGFGSESGADWTRLPQLPWEIVASGVPLPSTTARRGNRGNNPEGGSPLPGPEGSTTVAASGPNAASGGRSRDGTSGGQPGRTPGTQTLAQGNGSSAAPSAASQPGSGNTVAPPKGGNSAAQSGLPPLPPGAAPGSGPAAPEGTAWTPGSGAPPGGEQGTSGASGNGANPGNGQGTPSDGQVASGSPPGTAAPGGDAGGGNSAGLPQSILRPARLPGSEPKRPPPALHAARLSGDRDYVIFLECKRDSVMLYPSQRDFPLAALTGGSNDPLVRAVQQMIERRQSSVRPGDVPYRPQIRFLVRPETLRAYHTVYPLFDPLPLTKTRQNLIPEDDVRSIIAGN